jgi:hypothetical protein
VYFTIYIVDTQKTHKDQIAAINSCSRSRMDTFTNVAGTGDMTRYLCAIVVVFIVVSEETHAGDNRLSLPPAVNYDQLYKSSPQLPTYEPGPKYQAPSFDLGNTKREMDKFTKDVLDKHNEPAQRKFLDDMKRYETTSPQPDYSYSEPDPEPAETKKAKPQRFEPVRGDWRIEKNGAGKQCITLSYPQIALTSEVAKSGPRMNFGAVSLSMSPNDLSRNSVKLDLGYAHNPDHQPVATIQSQTFQFVAKKDRAFPRDSDTENRLLRAMKTGEAMIVRGVSSEGTPREDHYSLIGFASAYQTLALMCR